MRMGLGLVVLVSTSACTPTHVEPAEQAPVKTLPRERLVLDLPEPPPRVEPPRIGVPPRAFKAEMATMELLANAAAVQLEGRTLQFRGVVRAGDPCVTLRPGVTTAAGELTLTLQVIEGSDPCAAALAAIEYTAAVDVPAAGSLRVRVNLTYPNSGWEPATTLDTTVVVPPA